MQVLNICITGKYDDYEEKERAILDITISSIVDVLLNSICNSSLTIDEINSLITGFMQNGYFITLNNKFDINRLNNPFKDS